MLELDNWSSCKDGYMLNPSKCDYKYNKAWKIGEYLDHAKLFHAENVYMLNRY